VVAILSIANKITLGLIWNFADQLARKGVGLIVTLLLAKFLSPNDFGVIAMMTVFLALGQSLMDSGFSQALIRHHNVTQEDLSTAFYSNIFLALISYAVLFKASPVIGEFYAAPQLSKFIRFASLGIIINSFRVVQVANLSRSLNFKLQMKIGLLSSIISGAAAVCIAYMGYGVWALICQMLMAAFLNTFFLWCFHDWRPLCKFSWVSFRVMYGFGYRLFISGVLDTIFSNLYVIVIARIFSTTIAGLYFFADSIKGIVINQLVSSIQTVTYPALSSMQDNDVQLKSGYKKIVAVTAFILFPAILFIAALSEPIFRFLLPEKWFPSAAYLQIMCIATLFYPLNAINLNILKVKGRSDLFLYLEIIKKLMISVTLWLSVDYGIYGILTGQLICSLLAYIPNSYFSRKLINYPVSEQLSDFMPALCLAIFVAYAGYAVSLLFVLHSPLFVILLMGGGMASSYLLLAFLFKFPAFDLAVRMFRVKS
jgi:O-antigen/teichoic acid export membrane protein